MDYRDHAHELLRDLGIPPGRLPAAEDAVVEALREEHERTIREDGPTGGFTIGELEELESDVRSAAYRIDDAVRAAKSAQKSRAS